MDETGLGYESVTKKRSKEEFEMFCGYLYSEFSGKQIKYVKTHEYMFVYLGGRYAGLKDMETDETYIRKAF